MIQDEKIRIMGEDEPHFKKIPDIVSRKISPFLTERDSLSEYLSICNLGVKQTTDSYLLEQEDDPCTRYSPYDCHEPCKVYKSQSKCVHGNRIQPFREQSKELGHHIYGKHTTKPFDFIIVDSGRYYKCIISMTTRRLYVLFNVGSYIVDFEDPSFELKPLLRSILKQEPTVVLCGHSMGGSLALHCAEILATEHPAFFERCEVIALAPFPSLESNILLDFKNVRVYFTAVQFNGNIYIDPLYYENKVPRKQYSPFHLLIWDETVTEVTMDDLRPVNEMKNGMMDDLFMPLHAMSTYILFFSLLGVKKRKQTAGKRRTRKR